MAIYDVMIQSFRKSNSRSQKSLCHVLTVAAHDFEHHFHCSHDVDRINLDLTKDILKKKATYELSTI